MSRVAGTCRYVWNECLGRQEILYDTVRMFGAVFVLSASIFTLLRILPPTGA